MVRNPISSDYGPPMELRAQIRLAVLADEVEAGAIALVLEAEGYTAPRPLTPESACRHLATSPPDALLLDSRFASAGTPPLIERIRSTVPGGATLPVVLIAPAGTRSPYLLARELGAQEVLARPLDLDEILMRVGNLLALQVARQAAAGLEEFAELRLADRSWDLLIVRDRLAVLSEDLEHDQTQLIEGLAVAAEYRVDSSGQHPRRVGEIAGSLAQAIGLPGEQVALIRRAAPIHDLGTIALPDALLLKPGTLSTAEHARMRQHTTIGATLLAGARSPVLRLAREIARTHQERWDGEGYPQNLAGDEIPLASRIVALADMYDSLTHDRPYREALSQGAALGAIEDQRALHVDPRLAETFLRLMGTPTPHRNERLGHGKDHG